MPDAPPGRGVGRTMLRLLLGCVLITLLATAAASTTVFEVVGVISDALATGQKLSSRDLVKPGAGQPQTILILGSDGRGESRDIYDKDDPHHSDTILLVRLDPGDGQTSELSIPRDLEVSFYANGQEYTDYKINSAFTYGGWRASLRVVEHLLHIQINHIVVIDFQAFADIVNDIGCVYIDVDHLYDIPPNTGVAQIYIPPGYRPLCYYQALSYVRYRHFDSTYARDAREQDFVRQAKQQLSVGSLLTDPTKLQKILKAVGKDVASDIRGQEEVLRLVEIAEDAVNGPVHQVPFPDDGSVASNDGAAQAVPPPAQLSAVVNDFLYGTSSSLLPPPSRAHHHHRHHEAAGVVPEGLTEAPSYVTEDASEMSVYVPFPVEVPKLVWIDGSQPDASDYFHYRVKVPVVARYAGLKYQGYRITWEDGNELGAYYGVEGINWTDPPLFHDAPTDIIDGRTYMFVRNGSSFQDVGWIQGKELYWVSNTIFDNLSNAQMLAIAESTSRLG